MRKFLFILVCVATLSGCYTQKPTSVSSYYEAEPEFLNTEYDGAITMRTYGQGKNNRDAHTQALKNALYVVLFKGVKSNEPSTMRPLVPEANARDKHEAFFNKFFSDGGPYTRFVSLKDMARNSDVKEYNAIQMKKTLTVTIDKPKLKKYLIKNKIIK